LNRLGNAPLRGVLVGCGYIAPRHGRAWASVEGAELIAVCDVDEDRARDFAAKFQVPRAYTSLDTALDDLQGELDFVDISLPPHLHREVVQIALERGLHVLCQKPMAETVEDSLAIVKLSSASDCTVAINEMWKWIPAYEHIWERIRRGALGEVKSVRVTGMANLLLPRRHGWQLMGVEDKVSAQVHADLMARFRTMPELIVLEYGVHLLDMVRAWLGEPNELSAISSSTHPDLTGDDAAHIQLKYPNFDAQIVIDWCRPGPETPDIIDGETVTIHGSRGLLISTAGKAVEWLPFDGKAEHNEFPADTRDAGFARSHGNFVESIRTGRTPASAPEDNLRSQSLMLACYASSADGGRWIRQPSAWASHLGGAS